jgi:hypothetical protein
MALVTKPEKDGKKRRRYAAELAFLYLERGGDVNAAVSVAQMARRKPPTPSAGLTTSSDWTVLPS